LDDQTFSAYFIIWQFFIGDGENSDFLELVYQFKIFVKVQADFFALKLWVSLAGVANNNFGGLVSRGPPCGLCCTAQPKASNEAIKTQKILVKKGLFLFNVIFKRNKRFFVFYEDYHSNLKIMA
jgi:hypothetical protein